ncbi:MAG: permease [Candidatus Omnitrophica bacterium]|nr:permease [Candidatus Omnitrophota bacterium]
MFRKPNRKELIYLAAVIVLYISGLIYVYLNNLSFSALYKYGLLQQKGITGEQARLKEIETPLSLNIPKVLWYIYIKGSAVLVELFQYWIVGMLIAAGLVVFVPWEKVKKKMGHGGFKSNFIASFVGAVIPICSCGIVPVLAGMVEAGIPLGPTMAFLISAPMLNIPAVFMTAGVLGWKLAIGRIIGTFAIALVVGQIISYWQRKERFLRRLIKINVVPSLPKELQKFALEVGKKLAMNPDGLSTEELAPGNEDKLFLLGEAGILDRNKENKWHLPKTSIVSMDDVTGACFVLPTGDKDASLREKTIQLIRTAWDFFLQLNYYLVLAVLIAGAIKVIIPTSVIVNFVGRENLNSVLIASFIAVLAYVCTYVEVPTALALIHKGMSSGATLSYLLGGPGLSLPSIVMLSGVFKPKVLSLYVIVSFIGCVLAGYIFNFF